MPWLEDISTLVELMIEKGAIRLGRALQSAGREGYFEIVKYLNDHGTKIDKSSKRPLTGREAFLEDKVKESRRAGREVTFEEIDKEWMTLSQDEKEQWYLMPNGWHLFMDEMLSKHPKGEKPDLHQLGA